MRILACQITIPEISTKEQQLAHVERLINTVEKHLLQTDGIDLVLLPELACMQYSTENFRSIDQFAETLDGDICQQFANLCRSHQVAVCFGMARLEAGAYFISQVVLDKRGEYLAHYDKVHTAEYGDSSEGRFFQRGNHLSCFEIEGVKFGLAICYDLRFAELFQRYARECQVDVILHPVAFARDMTFASWHPFVITRALENQVYFISLNQAGEYFGASIICPPWVDDEHPSVTLGTQQSFTVVDIDQQVLQQVQEEIPYTKDTLADYQSLAIEQ